MPIPANSPGKTKVFLIEDHLILRHGLRLFLSEEPDFEICGEATTGPEALTSIETLQPGIILCDISLPGMNGIEFLKNLKASHPKIPAVVLSMHDEAVYAERALRAGALGYVMKKESTDHLVLALRMALRGEYYVSSKVIGAIFNKALGIRGHGKLAAQSPVSLLSDRELEIFEMIGRGLNTRDISAALRISPKTVESHRLHTKEKLQLQSAAELIQHATRWVEYESSEERSAH